MGPLLIFAAACALATTTLLVYGASRRGGAPGGLRSAVRVHGVVMAVVALLLGSSTGLGLIATRVAPTTGVPVEHPGGWLTMDVRPDAGWVDVLTVLAGPLAVAVVYAVAQRTFPAPQGPRRTAALTRRETAPLLPVGVTVLAGTVLSGIGVVTLLLATEPSVPQIVAPLEQWGAEPADLTSFRPTAAGAAVLPWIAAAVLATGAALAVGLVSIARRRPLEGLHPVEDRAVREVAANRLLRTGVVLLLGILGASWSMFVDIRAARDRLARFVPDHPAALSLEHDVDALATAEISLIVASLLIGVALLLWRSPALRVLRAPRGGPAATATPTRDGGPAGPGACPAVSTD